MKTFPKPLSIQEEREYLKRYKEGDLEAKEVLINRNLRLVAHVIKKYQQTGYDMDDLLSVGTIGLIKAVNTFNVEKGSRLATYAAKCVENAILSRMRLWFQTSIPRAEKNRDGVFWHRYPRICISIVSDRSPLARSWKHSCSISSIRTTKIFPMYRTGSVGAVITWA